MSKTYEFRVERTVISVQYVEVVDAHSEDEAYDTVLDLCEEDKWVEINIDYEVEPE